MSQFGISPSGPPRSDAMSLLAQLASQLTAGRDRNLLASSEAIGGGLKDLANQKMQAAELVARIRAQQQQQQSEQMAQMLRSGLANATSMYEGAQDRKSREKIAAQRASEQKTQSDLQPNIMAAATEDELNPAGRNMLQAWRDSTNKPEGTLQQMRADVASRKWPKVRSEASDEIPEPAAKLALDKLQTDIKAYKASDPDQQSQMLPTIEQDFADAIATATDPEDIETVVRPLARYTGLPDEKVDAMVANKGKPPAPAPTNSPKQPNIFQKIINPSGAATIPGMAKDNVLSRYIDATGINAPTSTQKVPWSQIDPDNPDRFFDLGSLDEILNGYQGAVPPDVPRETLGSTGLQVPMSQPAGNPFMQAIMNEPDERKKSAIMMQMLGYNAWGR